MKLILLSLVVGVAGLAACTPTDSNTVEEKPPNIVAAETPAQPLESPGSYRGGAVAAQVCAQCHDIGNGSAPAINVGAPAFREIAGRPGTTAEGLADWMRTSHPAMPNFIFSDQEVTDLAEYITNLANPAQ
jgi:mono/diheme cytochrome c family protein